MTTVEISTGMKYTERNILSPRTPLESFSASQSAKGSCTTVDRPASRNALPSAFMKLMDWLVNSSW